MQILWVLVLGLAYTVTARDCITSVEMDNFDQSHVDGKWHKMSFWTPNKTDEELFHKMKCVQVSFKTNANDYDVDVKYHFDGKPMESSGMFKSRDQNRAMFQKNFAVHPEYNQYNIRMLCTDYNNWAVWYSSAQYDPGHCSEHAFIMLRDPSKYAEMKNNQEMIKCLRDKMQISMDTMMDIPNNDCP